MKAIQIKREETDLIVQWDDGHSSRYPLAYLRQECPCAACKGEVIFGTVYAPAKLPMFTPGMNELTALAPTGGYGVQASWKDGHNTGIYSWDYLRMICPCEECKKNAPGLTILPQRSFGARKYSTLSIINDRDQNYDATTGNNCGGWNSDEF